MVIDPSTAFVSYSRDDGEFVLRLAKDLKAKGAKVWMDKLDLRPGQTWADEIEAAVNSCSIMLIVLSPDSVASRNVQAEVGYAISEGKGIIPIFYRQCNIPFRLLPYQYADFRTDYSAGLQELVSSLKNETMIPVAETVMVPKSPIDDEERRKRSADFHAHLVDQEKEASTPQAPSQQDQRKQEEAADLSRHESDQQTISAQKNGHEPESRETAEALARQAAEEKARRRQRVREEIFGPRLPKEEPKPSFAETAVRALLEQARGIRTQSARLRRNVAAGVVDWQQKLRRSLPTASDVTSKARRGAIVAGMLSVTVILATVTYETAPILQAKHRKTSVHGATAQVALAPEVHREVVAAPAPAPQVRRRPEATGTQSAKTVSTGPHAQTEPLNKPKENATTSSAKGSISSPASLPRNAAVVAPPTSASLPLEAVYTPPAGMSTKLAEVYRRARAGDADAMEELAVAFRQGNEVSKDDRRAVQWYRKAAKAGNPRGAFDLAECYEKGQGVPKDAGQAAVWYRKAADAGNVAAMNRLGDMYKDGTALKQDHSQALSWYRKAAEAGSPRGMSNLGKMYENGWGVPTNYAQAVDWYRKAASAGDLQGILGLGVMFEDGSGVSKDLRQALACYRKAADAGDATGMFYLADMYEFGKGVKKDLNQALRWYRKAAEAGDSGGMNKTAVMYEKGLGVGKDQAQAVFWYRKAAESGDQNARASLKRLGVMQ